MEDRRYLTPARYSAICKPYGKTHVLLAHSPPQAPDERFPPQRLGISTRGKSP